MDAMQIANSCWMWIACGIPVLLVIAQAVLFARGAYSAGRTLGLTEAQMKSAMKSSAITSIGPSIVVLSGMLSLLIAVGGPTGWMRLSMIGSVMFESIAAGIGTSAVGVTLGSDTLTREALGMAIWTMVLCSTGWVLFATFSADHMDTVKNIISRGSTGMLTTIAASAIIGVFSSMSANYLSSPMVAALKDASPKAMAAAGHNALACILGAAIMFVLTTIADRKDIHWLREWSLAITIVAAMIITALV